MPWHACIRTLILPQGAASVPLYAASSAKARRNKKNAFKWRVSYTKIHRQ